LRERRGALLRVRLAKNPLALELLDLVDQGVEKPKEQAEALKRPIEEIRNARKRLFHHVEQVTRDLPENGDEFEDDESSRDRGSEVEVLQ
jgi:hypothetical protein